MAKAKEIPAAAEERESFPRDWSDIRGHAAVIARLRHLAADGRLPHALMLTGTEGVGKRRTARVLARTLLCTAGGDAPCGHCDSCRTMAAGVHPDYFEVSPEARGKSAAMIRADAVRDILIAASESPRSADRRIILIDDVHCMNEVAANRLLKTLEEPPATVLFLLVTSAWDAVLPTIRSRAVPIAFGTVPRAEIAAELQGRGIEEAETIAALEDGSIGHAEPFSPPSARCMSRSCGHARRSSARDPMRSAVHGSAICKWRCATCSSCVRMRARSCTTGTAAPT